MKAKLVFGLLVFLSGTPFVFAAKDHHQSQQLQQAKVLRVEKHDVFDPDVCCTPNDQPLQSEYYAYDISVQVGCRTYDGRYETNLDYFPSVISPGSSVEVRLTKGDMYFNGPGTQNLKVPITHKSKGGACGS